MAPYWVRSLPTHRTPTIFIFAISLRGVVVAKIPVIVVCTAPGVPNGALGGVSGGSKRGTSKGDVEGSWGKVSIELRGMGASLFSHGGKKKRGTFN